MRYFDHAATSHPKDPRVVEAVRRALTDLPGTPGRGGHRGAVAAGRLVETARRRAAALLSVTSPERVTFALNATDALNLALKGLLQPGAAVVTTAVEHNSVARPLAGLEQRQSIAVSRAPADAQGRVRAVDILDRVTEHTRLVAMTHASNVTGGVLPVAEVGHQLRARARPPLLLVDVAQTAGYRSLAEVAEVADVLVASGHKGPGGPLGTGILWIRPGIEVTPQREGGTGTRSESALQPREDPGALEAGSPNLPGLAGLAEALRIRLEEDGLEQVAERRRWAVRRCLGQLADCSPIRLYGPAPGADREALVALRVQGFSVEEAALVLERECGLVQRSGLHCAPGIHAALGTLPEGTLRLSFAAMPSEEDIDFAGQSLKMLAREAPGIARDAWGG